MGMAGAWADAARALQDLGPSKENRSRRAAHRTSSLGVAQPGEGMREA